jgi:hypothetical protein
MEKCAAKGLPLARGARGVGPATAGWVNRDDDLHYQRRFPCAMAAPGQ